MEPEPGNPLEVEGVLNPAAARGPGGHLYLLPRIVARGNYSRIGIARVRFDDAGDPVGVERLGIALEPEAPYELRADGGGCEDPRITFVEPLGLYGMTYTAFLPWHTLLTKRLKSGAVVPDAHLSSSRYHYSHANSLYRDTNARSK